MPCGEDSVFSFFEPLPFGSVTTGVSVGSAGSGTRVIVSEDAGVSMFAGAGAVDAVVAKVIAIAGVLVGVKFVIGVSNFVSDIDVAVLNNWNWWIVCCSPERTCSSS